MTSYFSTLTGWIWGNSEKPVGSVNDNSKGVDPQPLDFNSIENVQPLKFDPQNPGWSWFNNIDGKWVTLSKEDSAMIEKEYQDNLARARTGCTVYHCFGTGQSAGIDFENMVTFCVSGKCICNNQNKELPDTHLTFSIKRN